MTLAISSAEMGAWDLSVPDGVMWWNERMAGLFGLTPGDFTGNYEDFLALLTAEDREKVRGEFARGESKVRWVM